MTVQPDGGRQFPENDAVPHRVLELLGLLELLELLGLDRSISDV